MPDAGPALPPLPPPPDFAQTLTPLFTGLTTGLNTFIAGATKVPADILAAITGGATQVGESARMTLSTLAAAPLAATQAATAARAQAAGAPAPPPAPTYTPPGAPPTTEPREFTIKAMG